MRFRLTHEFEAPNEFRNDMRVRKRARRQNSKRRATPRPREKSRSIGQFVTGQFVQTAWPKFFRERKHFFTSLRHPILPAIRGEKFIARLSSGYWARNYKFFSTCVSRETYHVIIQTCDVSGHIIVQSRSIIANDHTQSTDLSLSLSPSVFLFFLSLSQAVDLSWRCLRN